MYLGLFTTKTETPGTGNAYGLIPRSSDKGYVERGKVSATVKETVAYGTCHHLQICSLCRVHRETS